MKKKIEKILCEYSLSKETMENLAEDLNQLLTPKNRDNIRQIIELTANVEETGEVWGFDTEIDNIENLIDKAIEIIKGKV